jgi:hypothetical protein
VSLLAGQLLLDIRHLGGELVQAAGKSCAFLPFLLQLSNTRLVNLADLRQFCL